MTNSTKRAYEHSVLEAAAELLEQHYMRGEPSRTRKTPQTTYVQVDRIRTLSLCRYAIRQPTSTDLI